MNEVKPKRLTIPVLQKRLDQIFSEYIRLKEANDNGFCKCVTCGSMWHWTALHNGHYVDRRHIATRYDERNCHPCCYHCNVTLRGNLSKYRQFIIDKYGVKVLEELESAKRATEKYSVADYQEKIEYYRSEVRRIKKEKGL